MRNNAPGAAQQLADALIQLRIALKDWPPAAKVPPFNSFLGCLQALLRQQPAQLERLRAKLDSGLAQALERIEQQISNNTPESQIELIRAQLAQAMPQALCSSDQEWKEQFIQALEQQATQTPEGEVWQHLVALLHACVALLRGQTYDEQSLQADDLALLQQWQQVAALEAMQPAEREAAIADMQRQRIEQQADAAEQATQTALQSNDNAARTELAGRLIEGAEYFAQGEEAGSPYADLALFLQALAACLRNEAPPIVPPTYAERIARLASAPATLE